MGIMSLQFSRDVCDVSLAKSPRIEYVYATDLLMRHFPHKSCRAIKEEICLKCDYVIAGDVSGIMFNHVGDFSTVSVKSSYFYVK